MRSYDKISTATTRALGRHIKVNDVWFEVVGVLSSGAEVDSFQGVSITSTARSIYVPVSVALRKFDRDPLESPLTEIVVHLEDAERGAETAEMIGNLLEHLHGGADDYELVVPETLLEESRRTQRMFNIVMGCIAGISLLVGGIGIMNIMLASVLERTREIGIRRAVGAKRRDILLQFIAESFSLSAVGGLVGVLLGILIARMVATAAGWTTLITLWSVILGYECRACGGSVVGLLSSLPGVQPGPDRVIALRMRSLASSVNTIPAIRLEGVERVFVKGSTEVRALAGIDLSIDRGEYMAIMGASGSGKSTLLNVLGCLDTPTRGCLHLEWQRGSGSCRR